MKCSDYLKQARVASSSAQTCAGGLASRTWLKVCVGVAFATALLWGQSVSALTITPVSQGQFPSGQIIQVVMIVINPGETLPWHYHTGTGWVTVISGTLTEDNGCGTSLVTYSAGTATTERAGHVHRLFNFGSEPVVFTGTLIFPGCDPNNGTVFVNGPSCEGNSGQQHLQPLPNCKDELKD